MGVIKHELVLTHFLIIRLFDSLKCPTVTFKAFLPHHFPCATTFIAFLSAGDDNFIVRAYLPDVTPTKMNVLPITKSIRRLQVCLCCSRLDPLLCRTAG
jgi:hypothetical protein